MKTKKVLFGIIFPIIIAISFVLYLSNYFGSFNNLLIISFTDTIVFPMHFLIDGLALILLYFFLFHFPDQLLDGKPFLAYKILRLIISIIVVVITAYISINDIKHANASRDTITFKYQLVALACFSLVTITLSIINFPVNMIDYSWFLVVSIIISFIGMFSIILCAFNHKYFFEGHFYWCYIFGFLYYGLRILAFFFDDIETEELAIYYIISGILGFLAYFVIKVTFWNVAARFVEVIAIIEGIYLLVWGEDKYGDRTFFIDFTSAPKKTKRITITTITVEEDE